MQAPPFRWPLIVVLVAAAALNYCDRTALSAVYPLLRAEFSVSDAWLGGLGTAFLWSYALGSPVAGWIADHTSRTRVVLASLAAWSIVTLLTGLVRDANQLFATRILLGLSECAYLPAAVGLLSDHHAPENRGTAIGFHTAALSLGTVAGATLAGYLGERHGWRAGFLLLGGIGLVLAGVAARVLQGAARPTVKDGAAGLDRDDDWAAEPRPLGFLGIPSYWILLTQAMAASIAVWLFLYWLPLYFRETFGMSLGVAGFSGTAIVQVAGMLGVIAGGYLSDRVARRRQEWRMGLQTVCYLLAAPLLLVFVGRADLAAVAAALFGFSMLRGVALAGENPLLCGLVETRERSTAIGLQNTANCLAGGIGVLIAGLLKKDYGLASVFAGVSAITLLVAAINAAGCLFVLPRDLRRGRGGIA